MTNEVIFQIAIGIILVVGATVAFNRGWLKSDEIDMKGKGSKQDQFLFGAAAVFSICAFLAAAVIWQTSSVFIAGSGLFAIGALIGLGSRLRSKRD